uniref:Uncharacterized protein n=1 Tax=Branchiostoma floridae TaxID=7739 RepID=C3ZIB7_BRAFL|eukprot:XP_002591631.1 hypothetical protein BRAFLDRAFT_80730 [Branchiostoma floridae]
MTSLANKLQDLESNLKSRHGQAMNYGRALKDAIVKKDDFIEAEVMKSLGDLCLQKGKLSKDSAEFDKAAGLYATALLRCTDPDMGQTLERRIGYMEKLSKQLLQGYTPQEQPSYCWGISTTDGNVLRVARICDNLDRRVGLKPWHSVEDAYSETLVTALTTADVLLELETLKSLGDLYLEKGKKTSDVSQFLKAVSMYSKALRRYTCKEPGMKQTLYHRVVFAEKLRKTMRKQPSPNKSRLSARKPCAGRQLGKKIIRAMEDCHLHPDIPSQYQDHLKKGDSSLARADLNSAEQHFAAALKMVHVRDPTAQQYQREVEPLCKLGDVCSKRGQQTGGGGDFVKAAALYNAAIARSKDQVLNGNIVVDCKRVERSFLKCILGIHNNVEPDNTEKHKKQLKEMRDQIKLKMETIDQQQDPYVHDEDDPRVKEIEENRAQTVRQLFEDIAQKRKEFIALLVEECIGLMGPPPCKYALIGLGSQATGLVTPYSDLEFAILVEKESERYLAYFRNLTHYLHLKVVNFGETILPVLGIKSLNDFYSENSQDDWYYDSVTPRGFAFDGSMRKASKTPLGRQGIGELICTPSNMVSKLQVDATSYLKEGYHLASILRNPCLIAGDQGLMDIYMTITEQVLKASGGKMAQELAQEMLKENIEIYRHAITKQILKGNGGKVAQELAQKIIKGNMEIYRHGGKQSITASMIDVKKDLYRFPAVAVDCLALSSCIIPTTVWKTIEEMENQQVISPDNAHHLTVLTSISAELRLRTYIANGGQRENLSALASMETSSLRTNDENGSGLKVFHQQNQKQLFRYYYTAIPLKRDLSQLPEKKQFLTSSANFYDNSPTVQGMMYFELCQYRLAIHCYEEAMEKAEQNDTERIHLVINLGDAYNKVGDCQNAIVYYEETLQMYKRQSSNCREISYVLNNLWSSYSQAGDFKKAISCLEQALKIMKSTYGQNTAHPDIATTLNSLGLACGDIGDYKTAIEYFEQALQMDKRIFDTYGVRTGKSEHATLLLNLGDAWRNLGEYVKAISYIEQALKMYWSNYGQTAAHPQIANALECIGSLWKDKGNYKKAVKYHDHALQMRKRIYGHNAAHPDIALSFSNLGATWYFLGDARKVISYNEQALQMYRSIYGHDQTTACPDIATSLHNLGFTCLYLSDYKKAISYLEQSLKMDRSIYGEGTEHPDIASALSNLGTAWSGLGDHRKALSYYEQALTMQRNIYQTEAHLDIATSLNNVGAIWTNLADYRKAISYFQEALEMRRSIHGQTTAHPDIASSLSSIGGAWSALNEPRKAITYYEQALYMFRSIHVYGHSTPHTDIAKLLGNLGVVWSSLGDYKNAISYGEQALQMFRNIYGPDTPHPDIALALLNLGSYLVMISDHTRATNAFQEALSMARQVYPEDQNHPFIERVKIFLHALLS